MQKTQWRSRTSCRKFWWLDNSRSKSSQWKLWISKQSSISCGAGLSHSMDPDISVQNKKNFTRTPEKLAKVPGTREETKSHLHWQFLGIRQSLWRFSWNQCTSTPHRSETNGIAERAVRRVKEGTSAVLLQSGLNESWCADSMECYTYLRNVTDLLSDWTIPFGSLVEYHPITAKDQSKNPSIWKESLTWIVPRIRFVREENLEGWRTGCRSWGVGDDGRIGNLLEKDSMRKRWYIPKKKETEFFQSQMDESNPLEEIKTWEHPPRYGSDQFKEKVTLIFLENQKGPLPPPHDSFPDAGEAINDFWSMSGSFIYRHHVEPRVKLYSPREESFPIPLKYIDVSRTTHTNLDVKQERRIDDDWNIDGQETCQILGQVLHNLLYWKRSFQTDICGPGGD